MAGETIAVIDCDELAYVVAAACEKRTISVVNNTNQAEATFKTRTKMKEWLFGCTVPDDLFSITDVQTPEPLANALYTIKQRIASLKEACQADVVELYISGEGNFREYLPLPKKYKFNREKTLRPLLLVEIREYLIKHKGAVVVREREVDDKLCERMYDGYMAKQKIIGVTQDKDARGSSGWLYDPEKMSAPQFISGLGRLYLDDKGKVRGEGRKWLYFQLTNGDINDGINPCDVCGVAYGEKSAYKLLVDLPDDKACLQAVYNQYRQWYPQELIEFTSWDCQRQSMTIFEFMQMYLDCVRMRRFEKDTIDIKSLMDKLEIDYDSWKTDIKDTKSSKSKSTKAKSTTKKSKAKENTAILGEHPNIDN